MIKDRGRKMDESQNFNSIRKFQRVVLEVADRKFQEVFGALAQWPNGTMSRVFDMSYSGVAIESSMSLESKIGDMVTLHFHLGGFPDQKLASRVVWMNRHIVGFEFLDTQESRRKLQAFLHDKLLGLNLNLVARDLYPEKAAFSEWFHGPKDTNLYLWKNEDRVKRALLTLESLLINFENGKMWVAKIGPSFDESQPNFPSSNIGLERATEALVLRFISITSQFQGSKDILGDLKVQLLRLIEPME